MIRSTVLGLLFTLLSFGFNAHAKDLTSRLGLGFKNQFSTDLPGIAAQYYASPDLAFAAVLGVDTQANNSKFGFMAKVNRVVFTEDNLNFYMGAGAGLLSRQNPGATNESGFELNAYSGCEFFFTGLDSVGFSFEAGVGVTSFPGGVRFRTFGDSPLRAGILFYF